MKLTKKIVFYLSLITTVPLAVVMVMEGFNYCNRGTICDNFSDSIEFLSPLLFTLGVVFVFSLITLRMKDEVFKAWFKIAVWFVPIIIGTTIYLNATSSNGGLFNMDDETNSLILLILYSVFIILSTWRIIRTYRKTKNL